MAKAKVTTTGKGLGWRHQQKRDQLMRSHVDGSACDWCGRPMYRDRSRNWDHNAESTNPDNGKLHADHAAMSRNEAVRRGLPIPLPDRLLHGVCNIQRGDGGNDHLASVSAGHASQTVDLLMPWPW